jgi:hypothetical protein
VTGRQQWRRQSGGGSTATAAAASEARWQRQQSGGGSPAAKQRRRAVLQRRWQRETAVAGTKTTAETAMAGDTVNNQLKGGTGGDDSGGDGDGGKNSDSNENGDNRGSRLCQPQNGTQKVLLANQPWVGWCARSMCVPVAVLNESFLSDAFAGREGQTLPFKGRAHAAPALCKTTLMNLSIRRIYREGGPDPALQRVGARRTRPL